MKKKKVRKIKKKKKKKNQKEKHEKKPKKDQKKHDPGMMVTFYPEIKVEDKFEMEMIFVIDRSGSMSGDRIRSASKTMEQVIKQLPDNCYFNVIGFGTKVEQLFDESVQISKEIREKALTHVSIMQADLGGTDLHKPLEQIFSIIPAKNRPRQIFILTDGDISNTEEVMKMIRRNSSTARCFSFGIGAGASRELVNGIARAGNGKAVFIDDSGKDLEKKVIKQIQRGMQPALTQIKIDWDGLNIDQAPKVLPPIFNHDRFIAYGFLADDINNIKGKVVKLTAALPTGEEVCFKLSLDSVQIIYDDIIKTLAAKALIKELTMADIEDKDKIVELATKYGLASKHTSFVAVEERDNDGEIEEMELVDVPSLNPMDYQEEYSAMRSAPMLNQSSNLCYSAAPKYSRKKSACFIATAAYGTSMHPKLDSLRWMRDNIFPNKLTQFYYYVSPPIADFISKHDSLRFLVRVLLWPLVYLIDNPRSFFSFLTIFILIFSIYLHY
eukprot:Anaeramoba_ignava/a91814_52.p1 GENE.a91814_52~~a91814_52.p1  ORF type:complete len:497 (+),score=139.93 a91814_52:294-1784(+)